MAEIKTVLTDIEAQAKRGIACTTFNGSKTHFRAIIELIEAAVLSASAGKVDADAELLFSAKDFYNKTIADTSVVIRCYDAPTQLRVMNAGLRLRNAIASLQPQPSPAQQAIDAGKL